MIVINTVLEIMLLVLKILDCNIAIGTLLLGMLGKTQLLGPSWFKSASAKGRDWSERQTTTPSKTPPTTERNKGSL